MLQEFIGRNRATLIAHCRSKVLGFLAHELRNLIGNSILAVGAMKKGRVGLGGATGALLDRSLIGLRDLVNRTLVDVRLTAGLPPRRERIVVMDFIADVQVAATIDAAAQDLEFIVSPIEEGLAVEGDRQILAAAVANVLQNAITFTRPRGRVSLNAYAVDGRLLIDVEDECGGLPGGESGGDLPTVRPARRGGTGPRSGVAHQPSQRRSERRHAPRAQSPRRRLRVHDRSSPDVVPEVTGSHAAAAPVPPVPRLRGPDRFPSRRALDLFL